MQPFRIPAEVGQFSHDAGGCSFEYNAIRLSHCVTCWSVASSGNLGGGSFIHNGGGGRSDASDVLQKEEPRIAIGGDADDFEEQAGSAPVEPGALAGDGEVLARESGNDAIHAATPASSVEGGNVGPDRCRIQAAFFHARNQDGGCVSFPLNVAYGAMRDAQVFEPGSQSFVEHADAGKQADGR